MTRTIAPRTFAMALAAAATLISTAPAFAADVSPTQVRLDGRTQTQIRADVEAVATRLCKERFADLDAAQLDSCVSESVRATMKKVMARGTYVWSTASADD